MTNLVAEIGMKFDKNDIVIVAVAKIEAEIRKNIRESGADIAKIDEKFIQIEKEFRNNGESNIPKVLLDKKKIIEKALSSAKISNMNININHAAALNKDAQNVYTLSICESDEGRNKGYNIMLASSKTKLSKRQTDILNERQSLFEKREQRIKDGVDAKKQLQDLPAAERQMKAVVVEHEMSKSKEGQAVIKVLTDKYLSKMKQIEM